MKLLIRAGLSLVPLAALAVVVPAPAATASAPPAATQVRQHAALVPLTATRSTTTTYVADAAAGRMTAAAATATFQVTYHGFTPTAKAAFQRAVDAWAVRVSSPVPITVDATFSTLPEGVLGSAGPNYIWSGSPGLPLRDTYYVDAVANKRAGRQLDPAPDIYAEFSSSYSNWNFASAAAPKGTYDFQSVVMHELGHGLGFLGAGRIENGLGSVRINGKPTAYDRYVENSTGKNIGTYPDMSTALAGQIKGQALYFDTPSVRSANGGKAARLYAPPVYSPGSSYSHLSEIGFPAGNANSLMTPQIGDGETVHTAGPIMLAIFKNVGW